MKEAHHGEAKPRPREPRVEVPIERVQVGVRLEKRMVKVLKAMAEYHDMTLGEAIEEIVLHAFDGAQAFMPSARARIRDLKKIYGMDYDVHANSRFVEQGGESA